MIGKRPPVAGNQALEMTMRDVLDGMEELSTMVGFATAAGCMEILSVEPPPRAPVVSLYNRRRRSTGAPDDERGGGTPTPPGRLALR